MSTIDPASSEPEYLGPDTPGDLPPEPPTGARGRRAGVVAAAAVAVVAAVGAGAYGVVQLMAGGSPAAAAVPADAVGYVSLDLDPSASQKIEAFKMLRKFPSIKKELGDRDDIRRVVFEGIREDSGCEGLDYATDVEPWIGNRVAAAAVPDARKGVLPLLVLQVTDQEKAEAGAKAIAKCSGEGGKGGFAFVGDYMLVAQDQEAADAMARDAESASLADAAEFKAAMDRVGDPGIVTMFAAKDAPAAFATASGQRKQAEPMQEMFKDFQGAAGAIRFASGALEAEFTAEGLASNVVAPSGSDTAAASLPDSTAALVSVAFGKGWLDDYLEQMNGMLGDGESLDEMLAEGERVTGLDLPEDLETLLGDGLSLSVDADLDLEALGQSPDPTTVPAGIRITGDPEKIVPIIDKLKKAAGPEADMVKVASGDGVVTVGLSRAYVDRLLEDGALGSTESFSDAVPDADKASSVVYVSFDAGDGWAERLGDLLSDGDAEVRRNIAPLEALGVSGWQDDAGVQHGLLRLTTD
jgi:hypothetical protein